MPLPKTLKSITHQALIIQHPASNHWQETVRQHHLQYFLSWLISTLIFRLIYSLVLQLVKCFLVCCSGFFTVLMAQKCNTKNLLIPCTIGFIFQDCFHFAWRGVQLFYFTLLYSWMMLLPNKLI